MRHTSSALYLSALAALALTTSVAFAQDVMLAEGVPQPQQVGDITYITGGIGEEERSAIEAARSGYNLYIMSATRSGHFEGDTHLIIRNTQGKELLKIAAGPLFYAKLPEGRYVVEGSSDDETRSQTITIRTGKTAHVHFGWK